MCQIGMLRKILPFDSPPPPPENLATRVIVTSSDINYNVVKIRKETSDKMGPLHVFQNQIEFWKALQQSFTYTCSRG